jgi:ABC-2 type transport system permease protein
MTGVVFARSLRDTRRSTALWALGMVALVAFTVAFYPSVKGNASFEQVFDDLPEAVRTLVGAHEGVPFTSPPGYLHGRLFSVMVPVLLIILGSGLGARAIGGSEGDGTLELVLAHPVSRTRVVAERFGAVVAVLATVSATLTVSLLALAPLVGLLDEVTVDRLLAANAAAFCLALLHTSVAFAVGCAVGRSGPSVAVATSVAAGGYLLQSLAAIGGGLPAIQTLSPWHWYLDRNILVDGLPAPAVTGPLLLTAILFAAAVYLFNRRDLR